MTGPSDHDEKTADPVGEPPARRRASGLIFVLRLLRFSAIVFGALLLLSIALAAFFWKYESEYLARYVSVRLSDEVFDEAHSIRIGDIVGSPLHEIILADVRLTHAGGDTVLAANEIRLRYPVTWGLRGELRLRELAIDSIHVALVENEGGGLRLPWRAPERKTVSRPGPRDYGIDSLSIAAATVTLRNPEGRVDSLTSRYALDGRVFTDASGIHLIIARSGGRVPVVDAEPRTLTGRGVLADDRIRFRGLRAEIGESLLEGRGYVSVAGELDVGFSVELRHVETADAWKIVELGDVLGEGQLRGTMTVASVPGAAQLSWDLEGVLNGDPIDRLRGSGYVNLERFWSTDMAADAMGARVSGALDIDLQPPFGYLAEIDIENVDLTDVPIQDTLVVLHEHRFNGHVRLEGVDYEAPFPTMNVRAALGPSTYLGVPFDSLEAELTLIPGDTVRIESMAVRQAGARWRASGDILPERTCDVAVAGVRVPLALFAPLTRSDELSGYATFGGTITGDVLTPSFAGEALVQGFAFGSLGLERVVVPDVAGRLVPFDAELSFQAESGHLSAWTFESLEGRASVSDTIDVHTVRLVRSDSTFTARGRLVAVPEGLSGQVLAFEGTLPFATTSLREPAPLAIGSNGAWSLGPAHLVLAGGAVDLRIRTEPDGRSPRIDVDARGVPLLDVVTLPTLPGASGAPADVSLVYVDDPETPRFSGEATVRDVALDELVLDELRVAWDGAADSLRVSSATVTIGDGRLAGHGVLHAESSPVRGLFSPDPRGALVRPDTRVSLEIEGTGLDTRLPGRVRALVRPEVVEPEPDEGEIVVIERSLDLWRDVAGRASGWLSVTGPLSDPTMRAELDTGPLGVGDDLMIEATTLAGVYDDNLLTISRCDVTADGRHAQVSGFLPCSVDLAAGRVALLDRPMLVSIDLAESPAWLLSFVFPELIVAKGTLTGSGTIEGTPGQPDAEGRFLLAGGEARWFGRTETIRDVTATINLASSGLLVSEAVGYAGRDGVVRATGRFRSPSEYRFQVDVTDFSFVEGGMVGLVDGVLNVSPDSLTAGRLLPRVDGIAQLRQAEIFQWTPVRREITPDEIPALYDIDVEVGRIYVNTNELRTSTNILMGDGELQVRNYPEALRLGGQLHVLEGSATVYGNQFRITRGELNFLELDGVNPELDIEAETKLGGAYARERGYDAVNTKIIARVTGTLQEPVIELRTEPDDLGLSQSEIIEYLTIGRYVGSGDAAGGLEPTADILLKLLTQDLAYLFPYVDYVEVITGEEARQFRIVKSLSDELTIGYTTGVSRNPDQELSIEARLSRIVVLSGGVLREEVGTSGDVGGRYNLDLRLNFEY